MDRDKMLDVTLQQIEKQFGKGAVMKLGEHPMGAGMSIVPTGSLALDIALGVGGIPQGSHRRGLRSGGLGQDHRLPAHHRGGAVPRAGSPRSSTPSTRSIPRTRASWA